ncbi:MAG: hypothetical protein JO088_12315, partial [Acidobacteria bacterium]|nr:hypothetical protein [Acidobacteriota bacterium]
IKKYKLVHALMPSDEELEAKIDQLDRDLTPAPEPVGTGAGNRESGVEEPEAESPFAESQPDAQSQSKPEVEETSRHPTPDTRHPDQPEPPFAPEPLSESPFDETTPIIHMIEKPFDTGDEIPMAAQHDDSPFEEPSGYTAAALEIEHPEGMHVEEAPLVAEVPAVWSAEPDAEPDADVFAPAEPEGVAEDDDDLTSTTTMADLYVRQGLIGEARKIYQHMLERDPANAELRSKLDALNASPAEAPAAAVEAAASDDEAREPGNPATLHNHARVVILQQWLTKVAKREQQGG